ncbi:hypothetical protein HaLaN_04233, partial [Haematococcus lacustris]
MSRLQHRCRNTNLDNILQNVDNPCLTHSRIRRQQGRSNDQRHVVSSSIKAGAARRLQSRIDREERKKVLLEAKLSDDTSDPEVKILTCPFGVPSSLGLEQPLLPWLSNLSCQSCVHLLVVMQDVDLSSLQDAAKDSAEKDPPPQHINCLVLQPAQEDHDGVTSELGVLHTVWRGQGAAPALAAAQLMTYYEQLPETGEALWVPSLADMLDALVALGYRDPALTTLTSPGQAAAATHTSTRAPCTRHHQAAAVPKHPSPASSPPASLRRSQRGSVATAV